MEKRIKNIYLIGYCDKRIKTYKTKIKPLGYVVAGLGFVCLGVAIFPNGLGALFYPLGFGLLGCVGINTIKTEKKLKDRLRFALWRFKKW